MWVICSICKDMFLPDSAVSIIGCGHLYHELCINKWYEHSVSCPNCRCNINQKPQRIEFEIKNIPGNEINDSHFQQLLKVWNNKRAEEGELKKLHEKLKSERKSLENEISLCSGRMDNCKFDINVLKQQLRCLIEAHTAAERLKNENTELQDKVNLLSKLNNLLHGTENEMYEILRGVPVSPAAVQELCAIVQAMKYRLKIMEDWYMKRKTELMRRIETGMEELNAQGRNIELNRDTVVSNS